MFFSNLPLERGHDRLIALDDLAARIQYRVADIILVRDNFLPADQSHFMAENAFEILEATTNSLVERLGGTV